jgi:peptide/nickel transport system substrate-binding protein
MRSGGVRLGLVLALSLGFSTAAEAADGPHDITIVVPDAVKDLEPCRSTANDIGRIIQENVTETLTAIDAKSGQIVPRLATDWKAVDANTWQFTLRQGVKFHDGSDFDADTVVHTLTRMMDPSRDADANTTCTAKQKYFGGQSITTKVIDGHTLQIVTSKPSPVLPRLLSIVSIVAASTDPKAVDRKPIGTGPFVIGDWPSDQQITLNRFDGYWGTKPAVEKAHFVYRAESAVAAAMVKNQEADLAPYLAVQDATDPATDAPYLDTDTSFLPLSASIAPLNDVRVRKAIAMAIDRRALIGSIMSDKVEMAKEIVLPTVDGYNPDIAPWPFDPDQAKKLLAAAKADGVPVDAQIRIIARPKFMPNIEDVVAALVQMWKDVGLNVKPQFIEGAGFNVAARKPWAADRPPTITLQMHDNAIGDAGFTVFSKYDSGGVNSEIADPAVDKLIDDASKASGPDRTKLHQETFKKVNEEIVADVPLFHMVAFARVGSRITFTPTSLTNNQLDLSSIGFK